jgi:hypothetical protein
VWALAAKNGVPDDVRINFPVCDSPEQFGRAVKNGIIKGVSRLDRPLIEALQPYQSPDPQNSILRIVHDLDIADKHRLLVVVTHTAVLGTILKITRNDTPHPSFGIELPPAATMQYSWEIEDGVEVHRVPLRGIPNPNFEMTINATVQMAFEKVGTFRRGPIILTLLQMCHGVEVAIGTFADRL